MPLGEEAVTAVVMAVAELVQRSGTYGAPEEVFLRPRNAKIRQYLILSECCQIPRDWMGSG